MPLAFAALTTASSPAAHAACASTPPTVNGSYVKYCGDAVVQDTGGGFGFFISNADSVSFCDSSGCQSSIIGRTGAGFDIYTSPAAVIICFQLLGNPVSCF
ncbi:MAG: hypothetical protein ABR520_12130 [Mycobacteriales bacterium]